MTRSEAVAIRIADKLFTGRRGHGSTERIVERHLRYNEIKEIVKLAYELGWEHGAKEGTAAAAAKPVGDFTKRVLEVTAPPVRETHTHECDNCGQNFTCACGHPGEERMDCGGCKREEDQD